MTSSVLVVVDMQNGFVTAESQHVVANVVNVTRAWQSAGLDIVFTRFLNHPGSQFEKLIHWSRFMGGDEIELVRELEPLAHGKMIVDKHGKYSPFTPEFDSAIESNGWTELVICGIATESCVMKTACDAFERGLTPLVLTDASYSHAGQVPHDAGLLVIKRFIGRDQLISVDELFQRKNLATYTSR